MSKKALGKGLDALIHTDDAANEGGTGIIELPLNRLDSMDSQPRKRFAEETLLELAASIRENGIIQPVVVEKSGDRYRVIAGERRLRAARLAGLEKIPVVVRDFPNVNLLQIALIENIQRENLNPIEEAAAYDALLKDTGLKQEELASRVGKSRSAVANSLRLLKLPPDMQDALAAGTVSPGHARALLSVSEQPNRETLFTEILNKGLSVREAEQLSEKLNDSSPGPKKDRARPARGQSGREQAPELREIEQQLLESLGTKVEVKGSFSRGKIEVSYYSSDDLERLLDLLIKE